MLLWELLLHSVAIILGQFLVSFNELSIFVFSQFGTDYERGGHGVEDLVALLDEVDCILVIIFQ